MNINIYKNPVISCFVRYLGNGAVYFKYEKILMENGNFYFNLIF